MNLPEDQEQLLPHENATHSDVEINLAENPPVFFASPN